MNDGHKTHDLSHAVHVQCDDTLTLDERDKTTHIHSGVRVDVLCVENSDGGHVVIGVGRASSPRKHNVPILNSHFYVFQSNCALVVGLYVVIVTSFL